MPDKRGMATKRPMPRQEWRCCERAVFTSDGVAFCALCLFLLCCGIGGLVAIPHLSGMSVNCGGGLYMQQTYGWMDGRMDAPKANTHVRKYDINDAKVFPPAQLTDMLDKRGMATKRPMPHQEWRCCERVVFT